MLQSWFWRIKWRYFHCHCHDFRFYVTLFPKCFSNFRSRYLFDIGLPTLYLTLADIYLPLYATLPSSATLLVLFNEMFGFLAQWAVTFFGSILTWRVVFSNGFALYIEFCQSHISHKTTFLPQLNVLWDAIRQRVRSLFARRSLRESRLFSFPPLSNMLKFGGWPYRTQVCNKKEKQVFLFLNHWNYFHKTKGKTRDFVFVFEKSFKEDFVFIARKNFKVFLDNHSADYS